MELFRNKKKNTKKPWQQLATGALLKTKIPSFCPKPGTIYPTQSIDGS